MKKKKLTAILLAVSLVAGVFSPTASAAAAKQETVYVITKKTVQYRTDQPYSIGYTYTTNGMLKSFPSIMGDTVSFTYKNGKIVKRAMGGHESKEDTFYTESCTYNYGNNGKIKNGRLDYQETITTANENYSGREKFSVDYNKGGSVEMVFIESVNSNEKYTLSYDKNGNVTKMSKSDKMPDGKYGMSYVKSYAYDQKGNMKKIKREKYGVVATYKNSYDKSGNLVKKSDGDSVITYQYKKMKVPVKYADSIRQQQWEVINPYFSVYLGWNLEKAFEL